MQAHRVPTSATRRQLVVANGAAGPIHAAGALMQQRRRRQAAVGAAAKERHERRGSSVRARAALLPPTLPPAAEVRVCVQRVCSAPCCQHEEQVQQEGDRYSGCTALCLLVHPPTQTKHARPYPCHPIVKNDAGAARDAGGAAPRPRGRRRRQHRRLRRRHRRAAARPHVGGRPQQLAAGRALLCGVWRRRLPPRVPLLHIRHAGAPCVLGRRLF